MFSFRCPNFTSALPRVFSIFLLVFASPSVCRADLFDTMPDWRPIPPEETALAAPKIDPEAGAEILLRETVVDDTPQFGSRTAFFVRIKIFDERGIEPVQNYVIDLEDSESLLYLGARVIQPDGSVTGVNSKDIIKRVVAKVGSEKITRYSFTFPGLRPGCIIECQWKSSMGGKVQSMFAMLGDVFPIHTSRLVVLGDSNRFGYSFTDNKGAFVMKEVKRRRWEAELHDLPANPDDPFQPPKFSVNPWINISCRINDPDYYWKSYSVVLARSVGEALRGDNKALKQKAEELVAGIDDPREKLRRIYDFCTHEIVNIYAASSGYSAKDIEKMKPNKGPGDTLKNRRGNGFDIRRLFLILACDAGFEFDLADCNNRLTMEWNEDILYGPIAPDEVVMIKIDNKWEPFDPGTQFMPFGMILGANEATAAVMGSPKDKVLVLTPKSPSSFSVITRKGDLSIDAEGTLQGTVQFSYTGHEASSVKFDYAGKTPAERIDALTASIRGMIPEAEIADVVFTNIDDPDKNPEISFKLTAHDYAPVTGGRIMLQPAVFNKNSKPVFTRETRKFDIVFPFANEIHDNIRIAFPDNFAIEEGNSPKNVIDTAELGYTVTLGCSKTRNLLVYKKTERRNLLRIPAKSYSVVKTIYDGMDRENHHVLTLHRIEKTENDGAPEAAEPPSEAAAESGPAADPGSADL